MSSAAISGGGRFGGVRAGVGGTVAGPVGGEFAVGGGGRESAEADAAAVTSPRTEARGSVHVWAPSRWQRSQAVCRAGSRSASSQTPSGTGESRHQTTAVSRRPASPRHVVGGDGVDLGPFGRGEAGERFGEDGGAQEVDGPSGERWAAGFGHRVPGLLERRDQTVEFSR
ncbi:hypothetical protein LUR56_05730 [Streptomyces sp. MT29]|nr:hypothetical protein [Streptomyces sp. MT29]